MRAYDYVLAVGPSRSGTTFLYRHLNAHSAFVAPEIKEAHYYRSVRRFERALGGVRTPGAVLLDVADTAWTDPQLSRVESLSRSGHRILMIVLLRRHQDQVRSMMQYRRSRVLPAIPALLAGDLGLERASVRDSLTPAALERIFGLGTDVLTIDFEALVSKPDMVFNRIARLCRVPPFTIISMEAVNRADRARSLPLAAVGKFIAVMLRILGARRVLQALKDNPRIVGLFFHRAGSAEYEALSAGAGAALEQRYEACLALVERASVPLDEGLWFIGGSSSRTDQGPE